MMKKASVIIELSFLIFFYANCSQSEIFGGLSIIMFEFYGGFAGVPDVMVGIHNLEFA